MKIRIMAIVSIFLMVILLGCFKIYTSPPESDTSIVPDEVQNVQEALQAESTQPDSTSSSDTMEPSQSAPSPSGNAKQLPDLLPTEIIYDSDSVSIGQQIYFDSGIKNIGLMDSEGFNIKWFVNGEQHGHGGHPGVLSGNADMTSNSQFYWTPSTAGTYKVEFLVDSENFIQESDEENNSIYVDVVVKTPSWGETPVHLGDNTVLFDVYREKAEVDLDGDGNLDRIEYHAGKTITINGGVYPSTHENYAQSFAIVDISKNDGHLEILLNPAYRVLGDGAKDIPSSWFCWWDGEVVYGFGMKGILFDGAWRDNFVPSEYFFGNYNVTFLTPQKDNSSYYWGNFTFDPINYRFDEYFMRLG